MLGSFIFSYFILKSGDVDFDGGGKMSQNIPTMGEFRPGQGHDREACALLAR